MQPFLNPLQKLAPPFGSQFQVTRHLQFSPILDEHPDQAVKPDKAHVFPRDGRNQPATTYNQGGNSLGTQNGRKQNRRVEVKILVSKGLTSPVNLNNEPTSGAAQ